MGKVLFTRRAREDLLDLWVYLAEHSSVSVADRIYDTIEEQCAVLRPHSLIGRARPEIAADARSLVIKRWIVLYRIAGEDVQIVRVVDGARDLDRIEWTDETSC